MPSRRPKLLDLIAVLKRPTSADIEIGDVGTVVELLPPEGLEVAFLDRDGYTRGLATWSIGDVLTLNRERTPVGSRPWYGLFCKGGDNRAGGPRPDKGS